MRRLHLGDFDANRQHAAKGALHSGETSHPSAAKTEKSNQYHDRQNLQFGTSSERKQALVNSAIYKTWTSTEENSGG